ncbi:MAG: hypothetical protein JXM72_10115, partial [Deltaproteobacteria bacterium]|nr:hypothetical protein [Deltaproteobacteria bacterium]
MAYGKINSQVPNMKGIAVDLPFFRFRYVKVQDDSQKQDQSQGTVKAQSQGTVKARSLEGIGDFSGRAMRVEYTRPAEVSTLGLDPLVSSASVIHELVYGRIQGTSTAAQTQT